MASSAAPQLQIFLDAPIVNATGHEHGAEGSELGATRHTRVVTLEITRLQRTAAHLLRSWVADGRVAADNTVHLRMPSALFADVLADALVADGARYQLRPQTQFTHFTVARMMRSERRLIQCERFIARSLHTGTVVYALQHAVRYARPQLLRACYQWLRRTGGVTSSLILRRPDLALRIDLERGLLLQGAAETFDLAALAPLVSRERQRKRVYYAPPELAAAEASGGAGAAAAAAHLADTGTPEDGGQELQAWASKGQPVQDDAREVAVAAGVSAGTPNLITAAAASQAPEGAFVDIDLSAGGADVAAASPASASSAAAEAGAAAAAAAPPPAGGSRGSAASPGRPQPAVPPAVLAAAQRAMLQQAATAVEVGVVRPMLPSEAQPPTPAPVGSAPGPGEHGYAGLVRCFVVRRRDGHGPCRCVPRGGEAAEWAAVVQQRLGVDGDEDAVPAALAAQQQQEEAAAAPQPMLGTADLLPWLRVSVFCAGCDSSSAQSTSPSALPLQSDPSLSTAAAAAPSPHVCIDVRTTGSFDDDAGRCLTHDGLRPPPPRTKPVAAAAAPAPTAAAPPPAPPAAALVPPPVRYAAGGGCPCAARAVSDAGRHVYELRREEDGALLCAAAATSEGGRFVFARTAHMLHLSPLGRCV